MNLFEMASQNADSLYHRFAAMREGTSAPEAALLDQFVDRVNREGRLAVNLRPTVLLRFLSLEAGFLNIYEWAEQLAWRSAKPREDLLREKLGGWYERRVTFDRFLDQGEQCRYGALHLGGLGATTYGDYCLVFRQSFASSLAELAYLPADSLVTYMLPGPVVDEAALRRDACPHSHRQYLAALKHGTEVCTLTEDHWPGLVCSNVDFIEAVFTDRPTPGDLQVVIMDSFDYELYAGLLVDAALGRLSSFDRKLVEEFETILQRLEETAVPLEQVSG